jgi:glycerophosphoryl diester phosphodiesterase
LASTLQFFRCGIGSKGILNVTLVERLRRQRPGLVGWRKVPDHLRHANGEEEMGTKAIWTIAHRGASGHAPENTMAAFRRAVELGARFIETDLQITRDARVIAFHDFTLDRTTSGKGQVHLLTLEQIRALDAGAWFGDRGAGAFPGERVPTLEEILDFAKEQDVIFYLEIKSGPAWGIEHAVVAALRDQNASARVLILSFDPATIDSVHRLDSTMMTGFLCEHPSSDLVERAVRAGARQLVARGDLITPAVVEKAHHAGLQVAAWTINEPEQMRRLIQAGVDGIITDYPDRLLSVLRDRSG